MKQISYTKCGNILEWANTYRGSKFHALLCDAPYEYGFMGKSWDSKGVSFNPDAWRGLAQHLLPGAFGMVFGGARTYHRIAVAIEDAGLTIHPTLFGWCYASGFPKATNISLQIDKQAGAKRELSGATRHRNVKPYDDENGWNQNNTTGDFAYTKPSTEMAQVWEGHRYGLQALKPALEPIILFQKPYEGKSVQCMVEHGAGGLWIDGARIGINSAVDDPRLGGNGEWRTDKAAKNVYEGGYEGKNISSSPNGRWPANFFTEHHPECVKVGQSQSDAYVINRFVDGAKPFGNGAGHKYDSSTQEVGLVDVWECHPDCPSRKLNEQSGDRKAGGKVKGTEESHTGQNGIYGEWGRTENHPYQDNGGASRFFYQSDWSFEVAEQLADADAVVYCPKAARKERDAGLDNFQEKDVAYQEYRNEMRTTDSFVSAYPDGSPRPMNKLRNNHPTVKPIKLNQHLATLLLPPEHYTPRRLLVPFAGVASEMIGALLSGWEGVYGIEMDEDYCNIGKARIKYWLDDKVTIK